MKKPLRRSRSIGDARSHSQGDMDSHHIHHGQGDRQNLHRACTVYTQDDGAAEVLFLERGSAVPSPSGNKENVAPETVAAAAAAATAAATATATAATSRSAASSPGSRTRTDASLPRQPDSPDKQHRRRSRSRSRSRDRLVEEGRTDAEECEAVVPRSLRVPSTSSGSSSPGQPFSRLAPSTTSAALLSKPPKQQQQQQQQQPPPPPPSSSSSSSSPFQLRLLRATNLGPFGAAPDAVCQVWVNGERVAERALPVPSTDGSSLAGGGSTTTAAAAGTTVLGGTDFTFAVHGRGDTRLSVRLQSPNGPSAQFDCTFRDVCMTGPKAYPNRWIDLQGGSSRHGTQAGGGGTASDHGVARLQMRLSPANATNPATSTTTTTGVWLHVYDVSKHANVQSVNAWLKPLGMGGIYHAAVEIHGREYSFGGTQDAHSTGIYAYPPKQCPWHNYRESVYLGDCELSKKQVREVLRRMEPQWLGSSYNLFRKNCCDFSRELAIELGVDSLPQWLHVLAERTEYLEPLLQGIDMLQPYMSSMPLPALQSSSSNPGIPLSSGILTTQ